ncbi:MAG: hypothetical protein JWL77_2632 [Chthonomonadaceae bacterium]|nr:hypothetical protein [Chthonomonadaceae bacterium]
MARRYSVTLNTILTLTVMVLCFSLTPANGQTFDLRQLSSIQDGMPASAKERIEQGVRFLQQELASPSDPSWGMGGGPIDTGYIQSVILSTLKFPGAQAPSILRQQWKGATDPRLKDLLAISLAELGAEDVIPTVIRLARDDKDGSIRMTAMIALHAFLSPPGEFDSPHRVFLTKPLDAKTAQTVVDVFAAGLQDPFKRYYGGRKDEHGAYYPAQEQAYRGLRKMGLQVFRSAVALQIKDANGAVIRSIPVKSKPGNTSG